MKSHTPLDGLPVSDQAQYICVFRHPLDAHFSFRNHARNIPLPWFDHWYPEGDEDGTAFKRFLDGGPEGFDTDLMPLAHILRHYKAALALSDRPNVTLFHYADMSADLRGTFDRLQRLLGTDHSADLLDRLTEAASFDNMKQHAARYAPGGGTGFMRSDADFFHKGTSGNWHGQLSEDELWAYDDMMAQHLSPNARAWLEFGSTGTARRA